MAGAAVRGHAAAQTFLEAAMAGALSAASSS